MINHLIRIKDPVIENFRQSEINPIMVENICHSPKVSEAEIVSEQEEKGPNRIIIQDLKWKSNSVSIILIEAHFSNFIY